MTEKPINYTFHLTIVLVLLLVQFFIANIYGFFYLGHIAQEYSTSGSSQGSFFKKGEYVPVDSRQVPPDYEFVVVNKKGKLLEENYYTNKGRKETVAFWDGKWRRTSDESIGVVFLFLFLPLCGFILIGLGILRKVSRTGAFFTWDLAKHPYDRFEKICFIYGIPLHLSAILFGILGRAP